MSETQLIHLGLCALFGIVGLLWVIAIYLHNIRDATNRQDDSVYAIQKALHREDMRLRGFDID